MRSALFLSFMAAAMAGCLFVGDDDGRGDGGDDVDDDGGDDLPDRPDAAPPGTPGCPAPETGEHSTVILAGEVTDYVTGAPIAGAEVLINVAWEGDNPFPTECAPLATLTTSEDGRFGPSEVDLGARYFQPILLFRVVGEGIADTASDQTLDCGDEVDCGNLAHAIAAPSRELVAAWRAELADGGMPEADTRGLVLFEFRNPDATPAANVVPWNGFFYEDALVPDTQVRFLEPDRATVAPTETLTTTDSGVAVIGIDPFEEETERGGEEFDSGDTVAYISGTRVAQHWDQTGVLMTDGWVFLEDKQQSLP
jgi:hypothetical protein